MDDPILSPEERQALNGGSWFGSLSASLRHDLVRHGVVRRFADGEPVFLRGQDSTCWAAVVGGNVRVSTSHASGKQLTLCYMRPGLWFCDASVLHDQPRSYDAHAHGPAAMLTVCLEHAQELLRRHQEMYDALLRLHAARTRQLMDLLQDLQTLPLRARIAKQFTLLARCWGAPSLRQPGDIRIGLRLDQEQLAQLVSASRQRVNRELQDMRAEGLLATEQGRWVVRDLAGLARAASGAPLRSCAPASPARAAGRTLAPRPVAYAAAAA